MYETPVMEIVKVMLCQRVTLLRGDRLGGAVPTCETVVGKSFG